MVMRRAVSRHQGIPRITSYIQTLGDVIELCYCRSIAVMILPLHIYQPWPCQLGYNNSILELWHYCRLKPMMLAGGKVFYINVSG